MSLRPLLRPLLSARAVALVFALSLPGSRAVAADTQWVLSPSPEMEDASTKGAELRVEAQRLGSEKRYADAVGKLETLARDYPSSEHDCFLSLGYLRVEDATRAQLHWDVGRFRNGARPDWCLAELPKQIATVLRGKGYVPLTLHVQPPEAIVEVAGVAVQGLTVIWVRPGTYAVRARHESLPDRVVHVAATPPGVSVPISLEAEAPPIVTQPVKEPVVAAPSVPEPALPSLARVEFVDPPPRWPGWALVGAGGAAAITGGIFHFSAAQHRDAANGQFTGSAQYNESLTRFRSDRAFALGGYAVGSAALGVGLWWLLLHATESAP